MLSDTCKVRGNTADHVHSVIGHVCAVAAPLALSYEPSAAPWRAVPAGGSLAQYAPGATARFVRQALDALRQKALHPFVHKAPADPDRGSNGGDRDLLGDE